MDKSVKLYWDWNKFRLLEQFLIKFLYFLWIFYNVIKYKTFIIFVSELANRPLPLNQCVYMWEKFITPLSSVLQSHENTTAKALVCDCIANIGEKPFKELPVKPFILFISNIIDSTMLSSFVVQGIILYVIVPFEF